ncbi:oligosaccharide repeat unit polymerase [Paenibacillus tritici]|uniref:O-antigen polymerase n=1 Tax=Paenibacillus tritici TaxID=1873425 RepID=UPI001BABB768|nr:O-antigen polymerase [Paenibacillus tritici]QUL53902.1 oligosaccharide repeat unit polymerase [Paenibacillus tritici]
MKKLKREGKLVKYFTLNMFLYRLSLDFLYVTVLNEYHEKSVLLSRGIFNLEINEFKYGVSWIIFLIATIFVNKGILKTTNKASEILTLGLFAISFVPTISLFGLANLEYEFLYNFTAFWMVFLISVYFFCGNESTRLFKNNLKLNDKSKYFVWLIIVYFFCLGVFIISYLVNGLKLNLTLDSTKIYELRSFAKSQNLGSLVDYFRNNAMYIIIPFAGIYFWQKKNWLFLIALIYIQLLLYSIDNQKAALFILPASIIAYLFYKKFIIELVPLLLTILNILIFIESLFNKTTFLVSTLLERMYYLPAILSNGYFEYFKEMPSVVPFVSVFQKIGFVNDYPYTMGVPYIIGSVYFNNSAISANTGMFGSAYSYGVLGVLIIPLAYGFLLSLLNKVTTGLEVKTYISILIFLIYAITGATIFVVVSVYGFILALILLSLVNNNSRFQL